MSEKLFKATCRFIVFGTCFVRAENKSEATIKIHGGASQIGTRLSPDQLKQINRERLASWEEKLSLAHATPAVMIGIGHDEASGEVHLFVPEGLPQEFVVNYLQQVILELSSQ